MGIRLNMKKVDMPAEYFLLNDYIEELDKLQSTDFIPVLYPEINNKNFSKLERETKE